MKYLGGTFSVAVGSDEYRENYDRIFKKPPTPREIPAPTLRDFGYQPTGAACPKCGGALVSGPVRCPDGNLGCLVLHYGMVCGSCGGHFQ